MIITRENLQAGYEWWNKTGWPADFHNVEYHDIYDVRGKGDKEWWNATLNRLANWKAFRSPYSPNTKGEIGERGVKRLSAIRKQYASLVRKLGQEPSIVDLQWENIKPIFLWAFELKPGSVMCASKACHFLLPKVFIVTDNKGTGIFDYEFVWRGLKDEWSRFTHQEQAKRDLKKWINSESLHPCYPWETNIMELCLIGYKHGREQRKQINAK